MKKPVNKKPIIIVIVVLLIMAITSIVLIKNKKVTRKDNNFSYTRTIILSTSSLQETIVASGTIESQTTSTIASSINNATVSKINYAVGDFVEEGDIIIELDTTNLNKQITKQEDSLQDKYDDALSNKDNAWGGYYDAQQAYYKAENTYNTVYAKVKDAETAYNNAINDRDTKYQELLSEVDNGVVVTKDGGNYSLQDKFGTPITGAKATAYIESLKNVDTTSTNFSETKKVNNYDEITKDKESKYNIYIQAQSKFNQAQSTYDDATIARAEGNEQLEELYDTIADYKIKAKSSGQITNINAVLGGNANGTLATIQDTSKLKISLNIDEYDILKLSLGMKAVIETDASNKTYEGEVSQISPIASSSMGSSGGFEIEVKVTSEDVTGLLIGMNAEVTIIVSEGNQSFNVPIDAIEEKQDGTKVIYVQNEYGEFEELIVTTGESNGYYIEIYSNELEQDMIVRASANQEEAEINSFEEENENQQEGFGLGGFGMGQGMPGGNMPQGNNQQRGGNFSREGGGPNGFNR